jgi:hypothetical protein
MIYPWIFGNALFWWYCWPIGLVMSLWHLYIDHEFVSVAKGLVGDPEDMDRARRVAGSIPVQWAIVGLGLAWAVASRP